jgi:hypothetical protein
MKYNLINHYEKYIWKGEKRWKLEKLFTRGEA